MKRSSIGPWWSGVAVLGALCGYAGAADEQPDPAVKELTQPQNSIEASVGDVTKASYKFGEYNGLENHGVFGNGAFDIRSQQSYDSDSATRWRIKGTDLGLDTRNITGEYGTQGLFRVTAGLDEIIHNITDSYSTPYIGGTSGVLTLPATWMVPLVPRVSASAANARGLSSNVSNASALVNGVLKAPTAAQLATSTAIQGADLPTFGQEDLYTLRKRYSAGLDLMHQRDDGRGYFGDSCRSHRPDDGHNIRETRLSRQGRFRAIRLQRFDLQESRRHSHLDELGPAGYQHDHEQCTEQPVASARARGGL
jgi:hypothetical protein